MAKTVAFTSGESPSMENFNKKFAEIIAQLTLSALGAAPAGYGLGEFCTTITDWNTAVRNGWYRTTTFDANNNGPNPNAWCGSVITYSSELVVQNVYHKTQSGIPMHCRRWMYAGAWGPWEWIDPPMRPGVEYRTTERYLGKPVYVKLFDITSWTADSLTSLNTVATQIVDSCMTWRMGKVSGGVIDPFGIGFWVIKDGGIVDASLSGSMALKMLGTDAWGGNKTLAVKYTKE